MSGLNRLDLLSLPSFLRRGKQGWLINVLSHPVLRGDFQGVSYLFFPPMGEAFAVPRDHFIHGLGLIESSIQHDHFHRIRIFNIV